MKRSGELQKEILQVKLQNCNKNLEKIQQKIINLKRQEEILLLSKKKIEKTLENFGKSTSSDDKSNSSPDYGDNSEELERFLNSLSEDQKRKIPPSILRSNPRVEFLKEVLGIQ